MKKSKSLLKQDYYWECDDFYDKLPDEVEVIESHVEIFPKIMTNQDILNTYKIEPYTLEQATGILLGIIDDLKYPSRIIYFKDNDVLYHFSAYRDVDGELSVDVSRVNLDFKWSADLGVCLSNVPLNTQFTDTQTLSNLDTLTLEQAVEICKKNGLKVTREKVIIEEL